MKRLSMQNIFSLMLSLFCVVMLSIVGVLAIGKGINISFLVPINPDIFCKIEIAVDLDNSGTLNGEETFVEIFNSLKGDDLEDASVANRIIYPNNMIFSDLSSENLLIKITNFTQKADDDGFISGPALNVGIDTEYIQNGVTLQIVGDPAENIKYYTKGKVNPLITEEISYKIFVLDINVWYEKTAVQIPLAMELQDYVE